MDYENTHNEENELLQLIAKGDQNAFQEIFNRYWGQVYGTGLRLTKSTELAKDMAQEIFLKLWDNRTKLPEVKRLDDYLFIISRNLVTDYLRKKVLDISNSVYLNAYFQDDTANPEQRLEYNELEKLMNEAINRLTPQLQQVFKLHRLEGLSHEQIARKLNISRFTSKAYMVRALIEIRKYYAAYSNKLVSVISVLLFIGVNYFFSK